VKYFIILFFLLLFAAQLVAQHSTDSNLTIISKNGKYGFEQNGQTVIPAIYDSAFNFSEGSASVKQNGMWFYIKKDGTPFHDEDYWDAGPPKFKMARPYYNGLAVVVIDYSEYPDIQEGMEIIGERGFTASDYHHYEPMDSIGDFINDYSIVKDEGTYGVLGTNYQFMVPFGFERIDSFSNGWAKVTYKGRTFVLNPLGECIWNCPHGVGLPRKATADYQTIYVPYVTNPILSRAKFQLQSLLKDLVKQPLKKVLISGNGNSSYMAQQRSWAGVDAIANYLENEGIKRSRMIMQYGRDGRSGTVNLSLVDQTVNGPSRLPPPHPVNLKRK
jgi:hypothetical protein